MVGNITTKTALLIVNPLSRSATMADLRNGIELLERAGIDVQRVDSNNAQQTVEEINRHRDSINFVILAGGDGTIHSAAETLYQNSLPFGILPLGTANDFARSLAIPDNLEDAFEIIAAGHTRKIDLGVVNDHFFLNAVNLGLGVAIAKVLTPEAKKFWGVISYLKAMFEALSRSRSFRANVSIDSQRYRLRSIQLAVGNGRFYGGGNIVAEDAAIDDGLLHLYSIKPQSFWELLFLAPLWRSGRQQRAKNAFSARGQVITVDTSRTMEVYTDGEPATHTPARFRILPRVVEVFAPEGPIPGSDADRGIKL